MGPFNQTDWAEYVSSHQGIPVEQARVLVATCLRGIPISWVPELEADTRDPIYAPFWGDRIPVKLRILEALPEPDIIIGE
jgi:hypothetical protein